MLGDNDPIFAIDEHFCAIFHLFCVGNDRGWIFIFLCHIMHHLSLLRWLLFVRIALSYIDSKICEAMSQRLFLQGAFILTKPFQQTIIGSCFITIKLSIEGHQVLPIVVDGVFSPDVFDFEEGGHEARLAAQVVGGLAKSVVFRSFCAQGLKGSIFCQFLQGLGETGHVPDVYDFKAVFIQDFTRQIAHVDAGTFFTFSIVAFADVQ